MSDTDTGVTWQRVTDLLADARYGYENHGRFAEPLMLAVETMAELLAPPADVTDRLVETVQAEAKSQSDPDAIFVMDRAGFDALPGGTRFSDTRMNGAHPSPDESMYSPKGYRDAMVNGDKGPRRILNPEILGEFRPIPDAAPVQAETADEWRADRYVLNRDSWAVYVSRFPDPDHWEWMALDPNKRTRRPYFESKHQAADEAKAAALAWLDAQTKAQA